MTSVVIGTLHSNNAIDVVARTHHAGTRRQFDDFPCRSVRSIGPYADPIQAIDPADTPMPTCLSWCLSRCARDPLHQHVLQSVVLDVFSRRIVGWAMKAKPVGTAG
jgi:hypothetical protein